MTFSPNAKRVLLVLGHAPDKGFNTVEIAEQTDLSIDEAEAALEELSTIEISIGEIGVSPGVRLAIEKAHDDVWEYLIKYIECDWGDVPQRIKESNNHAMATGEGAILAAYKLKDNMLIIIATSNNHERTQVQLREEFEETVHRLKRSDDVTS